MKNKLTPDQMMEAFRKQPLMYSKMNEVSEPLFQNDMVTEEQKLSWLSIGDLKALLDYAIYRVSRLTIQSPTEEHDYWNNVVDKTSKELTKQIMDVFPPES